MTTSAAQGLESTSWRFRPQIVDAIETLGGLSADSIKMNFNPNHNFEVVVHDQGQLGIFMKGYWDENGNSGVFVDTMQSNSLICNFNDTCKFTFSILDTVLTLSDVIDQCSIRGIFMSGEYYGVNNLSNSAINEVFAKQNLQLAPNPAEGYTSLPHLFDNVKIISQEGKILAEFQNIQLIPTDFLPRGIYYLAAEHEGISGYAKLIVR